jgi:hypothetical protein
MTRGAIMRNSILPTIVAAVAISGVVVALAADRSTGPVDINQGVKGKADTTSPDPASEFRPAFKAAATATKRRDLVMKACDIEQSLRWDGATKSCQGMGFKIVSEYLSNRAGAAETTAHSQVFEESGTRPKSDATPGNGKNVGNTNKGEPQ